VVASICRRCAIDQAIFQCSPCGFSKRPAESPDVRLDFYTGGARCLGTHVASNLAELRSAVQNVVAEGVDEVQIGTATALQLNRAQSTFVPSGNLREARQRSRARLFASVLQHHEWRMAPAARTGYPTSNL
jgi:hypothetical protein